MKLKIISDGTIKGTKVVDQDTGEELIGVTSIEWSVKPRERPPGVGRRGGGWVFSCRLTLEEMPLEVVNDELKRYELRNSITADDNPIDVLASLWREAGYELDEKSFDAAREELEDADEEQLRRIVNIFLRQTRKKLSDVTDEERERLHENVPEFPTHRRET